MPVELLAPLVSLLIFAFVLAAPFLWEVGSKAGGGLGEYMSDRIKARAKVHKYRAEYEIEKMSLDLQQLKKAISDAEGK